MYSHEGIDVTCDFSKGRLVQNVRSHVLRLTLVNRGGPDTSPAYRDDTGLCIWSTGTFHSGVGDVCVWSL